MNEAIERLRKSKADYLASLESTAGAAGRAWAADHAEYEQLAALAGVDFDDIEPDESSKLAFMVAVTLDCDVEFFFGDDIPNDDYARAFFEAAQVYFNEVRNQL